MLYHQSDIVPSLKGTAAIKTQYQFPRTVFRRLSRFLLVKLFVVWIYLAEVSVYCLRRAQAVTLES